MTGRTCLKEELPKSSLVSNIQRLPLVADIFEKTLKTKMY
jgi:hypothetical protein